MVKWTCTGNREVIGSETDNWLTTGRLTMPKNQDAEICTSIEPPSHHWLGGYFSFITEQLLPSMHIRPRFKFARCLANATIGLLTTVVLLPSCHVANAQETKTAPSVQSTQGMKFGDATQTSVWAWTRVSKNIRGDDDSEIQVQFEWSPMDQVDAKQSSPWIDVSKTVDYTASFELTNLEPGNLYRAATRFRRSADDSKDEQNAVIAEGSFRTARSLNDSSDFRFAIMTCQRYDGLDDGDRGFRSYRTLSELAMQQPTLEFFSFTGDAVYYDQEPLLAKSVSLARRHWHRMDRLPNLRNLHSNLVCYHIKDDHDTLIDDCWPGQVYGELTFDEGVQIFAEQHPLGRHPFRTVRWGKYLQLWFLEGREFRSPNDMPDGPEKTILGTAQKDWLAETLEGSDADFKIVVQATPVLGPDRKSKSDNHANANFLTEGDWIRDLYQKHRVIAINGDRHWQYVSHDSGRDIYEFGTGPTHDARAGGWKGGNRHPMHQFLRVAGGFLMGEIDTHDTSGEVTLRLSHHDVTGKVEHQKIFRTDIQ